LSIDAKALLQEVRENHARLDSCARHEFKPEGPENKLGVKYQCIHCQGQTDAASRHWYERGLAHGAVA
jgi:hypothetical protein